jgi:hypothetical protein
VKEMESMSNNVDLFVKTFIDLIDFHIKDKGLENSNQQFNIYYFSLQLMIYALFESKGFFNNDHNFFIHQFESLRKEKNNNYNSYFSTFISKLNIESTNICQPKIRLLLENCFQLSLRELSSLSLSNSFFYRNQEIISSKSGIWNLFSEYRWIFTEKYFDYIFCSIFETIQQKRN